MISALLTAKKKYSLVVLIVIIFSAIRFDVGFDFKSYYYVINGYDTLNYNRFGPFDKGFIEISNWIHFPQFYFIVTSLIIYSLIFLTIRNFSINKTISVITFLAFPILYFHSLNIIRQFIAISIIFYSFKDIYDRRLLAFLLKVCIASFFHFTALVAIPIYFLYKSRISILNIIVFSFIFWYLSDVIINDILLTSSYGYLISLSPVSGLSLSIFLSILLFLCIVLKINLISKGLFNIFFIGVVLYIVTYSLGEQVTRISYYYLVFIILLLPYFLTRFKNKYSNFVIQTIMLLLFIFNFYLFEKNETKNPIVPYKVFFMENPDYYKWK